MNEKHTEDDPVADAAGLRAKRVRKGKSEAKPRASISKILKVRDAATRP